MILSGRNLLALSAALLLSACGLFGDDDEDDPYGIAIAIQHDFGWNNQTLYTLYAHLSSISAGTGTSVSGGAVIGQVGSTGWSTSGRACRADFSAMPAPSTEAASSWVWVHCGPASLQM